MREVIKKTRKPEEKRLEAKFRSLFASKPTDDDKTKVF